MELAVIKYIKEKGLKDLEDRLAISAKRHKDYPNLVLLKYDQINSPMGVKVVQECRGIILDEAADWKVVSFPYVKFFNEPEGHAAKIDWSSARVYEKLDGSLMTLYYYDGNWLISSSGMPDAAGEVNGFGKSFAQLFWEVWDKLGYELPGDTNNCYMFELMTKYNRVVVKHEESDIVLHGARRLSDFKELNPVVEAHNNGWKCVKIHPLHSVEDALEAVKHLDPMTSEGYVVCDGNYNRIKIKSPQYVALSHLKESVGMSKRQLLEVVRRNESSEFLSYFPEFASDYYDLRAKYERLLGKMEGFYEATKHISERKDFAAQAKKVNYSDALFQMKYGKITDFKHYIAEMQIKSLESILGLKLEVVIEDDEETTGSTAQEE